MRNPMNFLWSIAVYLPMLAWAQTMPSGDQAESGQLGIGRPVASDGGSASVLVPQAVSEAEDVVNRVVAETTTDGLVLVVRLDGAAVELLSASPARIPVRGRREAAAQSEGGKAEGGVVTAVAYAGGQVVGRVAVSDLVLNASEGDGLVKTPRREVVLPIPVERAPDSVEIEAALTGARARVATAQAYAEWCRADAKGRWCPAAGR